ncbi:MAG: GGDEF domain-containing protein [Deinococcales bacterium]
MPEPLSFDPPTRPRARVEQDPGRRLVVRSAFLAGLAVLALARLVPLPSRALLPLAALGLALYAAMALGRIDVRRGLRFWVPLLDLGLLYVLVGYTPAPESWGSLAYVWLAGQAVVERSSLRQQTLPYYAAAAWTTLALASLHLAHPLSYMAGHTIALGLLVAVGRTLVRERRENELDPLTGTLTRRAGLVELERRLERALPFSVAVVDVRNFKRINDAYGHAAGDQALRVIGRRLHHALRPEDVVIRYGGDEFVVVSEAEQLEPRLRAAFDGPIVTKDGAFEVEVDVGVMPWRAGLALADILAEADRRMYATKRAG